MTKQDVEKQAVKQDRSSLESQDGDGHSHTSTATSRHTVSMRTRTLSHIGESLVGEDSRICGCFWSRNSKTFFLSLVMTTTITAAQVAGALAAGSMALLADCASMAVDAMTYAFNLVAECKQEENEQRQRRNQLIASGISFFALIAISILFLVQGITDIQNHDWDNNDNSTSDSGSDNGDVNPYIVFGFAVAGIVFDLVSLTPYIMYGCPCIKKEGDDDVKAENSDVSNLCSAFMHISADLLRSFTTFTESILIWAYGINGDAADAYATVIVLATIILGLVKPVYDWVLDLRDYREEYTVLDENMKLIQRAE
eukprot:TRINITY_DN5819_c0_g1_i1.p1 TRINITY_DN5819_c0_g1~~TRINITY_DN5819_c0_g1_i1.p1  ORF type:complete len:312 (+),score=128.91 TRINITY_DN5819_c0_g1_i1:188-1123(+)